MLSGLCLLKSEKKPVRVRLKDKPIMRYLFLWFGKSNPLTLLVSNYLNNPCSADIREGYLRRKLFDTRQIRIWHEIVKMRHEIHNVSRKSNSKPEYYKGKSTSRADPAGPS